MLLRLRGLAEIPEDVWYVPGSSSGPPPHLTWWVDKERSLVLRRAAVESVSKRAINAPATEAGTPVQLRVTETFTVATLAEALPAALFDFEPPADAKQVPNRYGR